jgi:hypothetical protein
MAAKRRRIIRLYQSPAGFFAVTRMKVVSFHDINKHWSDDELEMHVFMEMILAFRKS